MLGNARAASSCLDREISVIIACCRQSDGMLKAISNAMVFMVSESPAKRAEEI